jgi:hypothetical protein
MLPPRQHPGKARVLRLEGLESRLCLSASLTNASQMIGLDQVRAEYGLTGSGQTVAVIDTGIAYDHSALGGGYGAGHRVVGGYDFAENDNNPYDDGPMGSHGTHVAGIVASADGRALGVAPGADIVALRVFNDQGHSELSWIEEALEWVHAHRNSFEHPITTVNLSLGAASNTESVPAWATLEGDLAQLERDGIFISVAAGNGFATYHAVGLSYPAVSPYVVPVASLDASGSLSYFSQRDSRVIAAPGRSIVSTLPDYMGNHNGVADDFGAYSGTSMAAPSVAGASMLLRQAYAFAGVANVSEQMLYHTMIVTADAVYDPVTRASYHRLNLDRAIDSVMPADDFGSTAAAAANLGTVVNSLSLNGAIGQLGDHDWFSFKAGASGKVTLVATASGDLLPQWEFATTPANLTRSGNTVSFTVVAGQTYALGLSTGGGLGHYSVGARLEANRVASLVAVVGQEIRVSGTAGNDSFTLSVGDTYRLTVNGVEYQFDRRAVNSLVFDGGAGRDTIVVQAGAGGATAALQPGVVDLNGLGYKIHAGSVEAVTVRAGSGLTRVTMYDSPGNDTLVATPTYAELSGPGFVNRVEGFSSVCAVASGGSDVARLLDSPGNDTLSVAATDTTLAGQGFSNRVRFFDDVQTSGEAGGRDSAVLYNLTTSTQLSAAGKKAEVVFGSSGAGNTLVASAKISLAGFKYVRGLSDGGRLKQLQRAAIDFVLDLTDRRA